MARAMHDTTEIYRAVVRHKAPWLVAGESTSIFGPYGGPSGKGHARRRISEYRNTLIEGKVQKLEAADYGRKSWEPGASEFENDIRLEWVDVDG